MTILIWNKPKQVVSKEEWASNQADSAPPGTYVPNMSKDDIWSWKAKLVGHKSNHPQVEIRYGTTVIIVHNGKYKYKHYDTREKPIKPGVHIATAGPFIMSLETLDDFNRAILEAREYLNAL